MFVQVIDRDFRGNLTVILHNFSNSDYNIKIGSCIAQLICERAENPIVSEVSKLSKTDGDQSGFGSTGY